LSEKMQLDLSVSHKFLKPFELQQVYLMLQLKQPKIEVAHERSPINVSFVLDRSGSMAGEKLAYTKKAVAFALEHLDSRDDVSIVTFDDQVDVLIPAQKAVHKDQLIQVLHSIRSGGCTNLSGGLFKGVSLVKEKFEKENINRVLLLTDGLANAGITDPAKLLEKVKEIYSRNISISTFGVGDHFQEDLLVDMAEAGGGNFYYISSPDTLPEIFNEELQGLLNVTGQNLELAILPSEQVKVTGILGYEPKWGPETKINLPDIYSGDTKTILIELTVSPQLIGKCSLGMVKFKYDDVLESLSTVNFNIDVSVEATNDPDMLNTGVDLKVVKEVEIFETARIKEEAMKQADAGNFPMASTLLNTQKDKLHNLYASMQDSEVLEEINKLEANYQIMESQNYTAAARKEMKYTSHQTRRKR